MSLEASRSRILLYLLLTAPPAGGRRPGGRSERSIASAPARGFVLICSHLARAVFALLLASSLLSLAFYPLVFGILLSRKAYGLAKTAMVAQLAPERTELATASGHLARTGTIAGGIGTAVGGRSDRLVGVEVAAGRLRQSCSCVPPFSPGGSTDRRRGIVSESVSSASQTPVDVRERRRRWPRFEQPKAR